MDKIIKLESHGEAQALFGPRDEYLRTIEKEFKVKLTVRGGHLVIKGVASNIQKASGLVEYILEAHRAGQTELGQTDFHYLMTNYKKPQNQGKIETADFTIPQRSGSKQIGP